MFISFQNHEHHLIQGVVYVYLDDLDMIVVLHVHIVKMVVDVIEI